jgi:Flp pilus assembly protein CpaB
MAIVTSFVTSRRLAERPSRREAERVMVLVAKKSMNMGDTIKVPEDTFGTKAYPRGEEPRNAILDAEQLKGRVVKRPLRANDFVTEDDLLADSDEPWGKQKFAPGYRAVAIRVSNDITAYALANLPNSRVDVISTVRRSDGNTAYSQVLLNNALVLSAEGRTERDKSGKLRPYQVVTLALRGEDALRVALAGEVGPLRIMRRKMAEPAEQ